MSSASVKSCKELTADEMKAKFSELTSKTVDDQAAAFLRSYVGEFGGRFEEILDTAQDFKRYGPKSGVCELEEDAAHLFLEKRSEALTVRELRDALRAIDIDMNKKMSFIEFLLWKYSKTLKDFYAERPGNLAALLAKLEEAIAGYQKSLAEKEAREARMRELEAVAQEGGVKGMKAMHELEAMRHDDNLARNKKEVEAAAKKRMAQKAFDNGDPFEEEQKRLAAEKKKEEEAKEKERQEARARLKAKVAAWN
jgi:hypothetical protein